MGSFEKPLRLTYIDGRDWEVYEAFTYTTTVTGQPTTIVVPAGTPVDFASIPRFFWRVLPPVGKYGKAAVVHDAIYRDPLMPFTREQADQIFLDGMADLGVPWPTRKVMYRAVRMFGGRSYKPRTVPSGVTATITAPTTVTPS